MSRILLADDSAHAQRMGERILCEEGYEVVTVTDGETALVRLPDAAPHLILVGVSMPKRSGYEVCEYVKSDPRFQKLPVVLTVAALEPYDELEAKRVRADGLLRKPFEASLLLETIRALLGDEAPKRSGKLSVVPQEVPREIPRTTVVDRERVRAAVILALDASMPQMTDAITERVLAALSPNPRPAPQIFERNPKRL